MSKPLTKETAELKAVFEKHGYKIHGLAARIVELESELASKPSSGAMKSAEADNLTWLSSECERLQSENVTLRARLGIAANATATTSTAKPGQSGFGVSSIARTRAIFQAQFDKNNPIANR
jgi:arylamine N-acetyltransferase